MKRSGLKIDKDLEIAVNEILRSKARSRIYIFLLMKKGAKTEEIIKGTKLHPSTVRETLSQMYEQRLIHREKIKNDNIGKNPYIYYPKPPIVLLKQYANEVEERLNKLANFASYKKRKYKAIEINILEGAK